MGRNTGINIYPVDQGQQTQLNYLREEVTSFAVRRKTVRVPFGSAAAGVSLIPMSDIPEGHRPILVGYRARVDGATAWTGATEIRIETEATGTPHVVIPATAATANAVITETAAHLRPPYIDATGADTGEGLVVKTDTDATAGSDLVVTVFYELARG